jgi:addiction module HigA family antidote
MPGRWPTSPCRRTTGSKLSKDAGPGSTAFGSTGNGAFASFGRKEVRIVSRSSIATDEIPNPTPGGILLREFIEPMGLTQSGLARAIGVPPRWINEIVLDKRAVTADTDLRLGRYFGLSAGFWLRLRSDHDLMRKRRKIGKELYRIDPRPFAA